MGTDILDVIDEAVVPQQEKDYVQRSKHSIDRLAATFELPGKCQEKLVGRNICTVLTIMLR